MKAEVRLNYGRVGEFYDGSIWVQVYPTRGRMLWLEFERYSFPRMMSKLAECIREHEETEIVLSRTEVSGSYYKLDADTVQLLKTDPAAAISHMMPESRVVLIRKEMKPDTTPPSGLLRAGHDTIADAFGDDVYCTTNQEGKTECPGCGRWSLVNTRWLACANRRCGIRTPGTLTGKLWFVVSIEALLQLNLDRYYLPRSWNPTRGWISRDDLKSMYETFQQEREQCSQQNVPKE